jgi:hypothetical protein
MPVLVAVGLIFLTSGNRRLARSRPALDGVAFVLAGAALVWLTVLNPTYAQSDASHLEKAVSAAYPIGDVIVAYALAVAAAGRWGRRDGYVLSALLAGVLVLMVADIGFASLTLNDRYSPTSLVNLGWPCGFLVIGYAAALGIAWPLSYGDRDETIAHREWLIPIALSAVLITLFVVAFRETSLAVGLPVYAMVGISLVAVGARLAINLGLGREIEAKRERVVTWLLEHKNAA